MFLVRANAFECLTVCRRLVRMLVVLRAGLLLRCRVLRRLLQPLLASRLRSPLRLCVRWLVLAAGFPVGAPRSCILLRCRERLPGALTDAPRSPAASDSARLTICGFVCSSHPCSVQEGLSQMGGVTAAGGDRNLARDIISRMLRWHYATFTEYPRDTTGARRA